MPNLHITLSGNSFKVDEAPDLNFSPAFMALLVTFLHRAGGPDPTQEAIDALTARLKAQNDALQDLTAKHTPTP